jgi:hypothetical protein
MLDWRSLTPLSDAELAAHDVAAVNLACADGLPGAEAIDAPGCLQTLDRWAVGIRRVTERAIETSYRRDPARYDHSVSLFRVVRMVAALQKDCEVRYDPAKIGAKPTDPFDFHEHFVHGPIQGPGGTCATLPILLAAVGRRLGYPIRLVKAKCHMFARWDDPATGERFNIDWSQQGLMNTPPDDRYRLWPYPINDEEERLYGYLKSLTPREELAQFVARRGYRWWDVGQYRRAVAALLVAVEVDRSDAMYPVMVREYTDLWDRHLRRRRPSGFPKMEIRVHPEHRRWPVVPWDLEKKIRFLEAAEELLDKPDLIRDYWDPLRQGRPTTGPRPLPRLIEVDCTGGGPCSTQP